MSYNENQDTIILELSKTVTKLKAENDALKQELEIKNKLPIPKSVVQQIVEMQAIIRKLESDLKYYKQHVPTQILINKENKNKPTRRGGIPK